MFHNTCANDIVVDELQSFIEHQIKDIESRKQPSSVLSDVSNKFTAITTSADLTSDLLLATFVAKVVEKLCSQLEQIFLEAVDPNIGSIRISSILKDLQHTVKSMCSQYYGQVPNQTSQPLPSIKLGSVFAWAREQSGVHFNGLQICSDLRRNRLRLCRKLCRLVRLSKSSKLRSQSHPVLVSLRHDLMKIRSRASGKVLTEKPLTIVSPTPANMKPIYFTDDPFVSFEKPIIQSKLVVIFEKLADQITDLLLPISHLIPGISVVKTPDDTGKRRENLRAQVILAIQGFYCHFNETTEDTGHDFENNNSTIEDSMNGSYALPDLTESSSDDDDITGSKLTVQMNPAMIQASLDRFDHFNWNKQKRSSSSASSLRAKEQTTDQLTSIRQQGPIFVRSITSKGKMGFTEPTTIYNTDITSPINQITESKEVENSKDKNVEVQSNDVSMESVTVVQIEDKNEENKTEQQEKIENCDKSTKSHSTSKLGVLSKKHTTRSLRTRHSRTPSDASFSEGEVLSDTEEDLELSDNGREQKDGVGVHEKTKPVENDGKNDDLVKLVHDPLHTTTPISDVDLTELEIMDEWAPPVLASNRMDTSISLSDISLPAEEMKDSTFSHEINVKDNKKDEITELLNNSIEFCSNSLQELIIKAEVNSDIQCGDSLNNIASQSFKICLTPELEASIERTTTAFKEHVTSVLANLLHAVPGQLSAQAENDAKYRSQRGGTRRQQVVSRRGSRLRGMLLAYQQEAVKRLSSSTFE
ncbi:unnamed protein product [Heterobilharzia americana]|nr:unnamed protein product [Heterobilharzia americana]